MLQAIELVVLTAIHVAARIGRPNASIADSEHDRRRTQLQLVHPIAVVASILMPPSTLILRPVTAATIAKQKAMLVIEEFHFVIAPPSNRMQGCPNSLGHCK